MTMLGTDRDPGPGGLGSRRWLAGVTAAAGAAGLAAAVAVITVSSLGQTTGPASPQAAPGVLAGAVSHAEAVQLLIRASGTAARARPLTASGRQFAYSESLVSFGNQGGPASLQTHLRQVWTPTADLCAGGLMIEYGKSYRLTPPKPAGGRAAPQCPDRGQLNDPTIRLLRSLPTRPQDLLKLVSRGNTPGLSADAVAWNTMSSILREPVVPPDVGAALFRAAALLPETTMVPQNFDAIGRPGPTVLFTFRNLQLEWVFDARTFRLLGELDFANGTLTGESTTLARAIVGHAGEVPPGGVPTSTAPGPAVPSGG
jgi:hypothetical protein